MKIFKLTFVLILSIYLTGCNFKMPEEMDEIVSVADKTISETIENIPEIKENATNLINDVIEFMPEIKEEDIKGFLEKAQELGYKGAELVKDDTIEFSGKNDDGNEINFTYIKETGEIILKYSPTSKVVR